MPVSLERIREMLAEPQAPDLLGTLNGVNATTFRVDITEQAKLDDLMAALRFEKPGPQVAGGNDAYEQYQRLFPPVDNPLVQPYAAFSTRQVIPLAVEALIEKYVVDRIADVAAPASHKD
ncbi:MAG TPA: hypothetical protein VLV86_17125 [Vicinamibacterales bacterium]|nr:hypothetical protein [Vicinamibacterales bacterium]